MSARFSLPNLLGLLGLLALACESTPLAVKSEAIALWRPPPVPSDAMRLRIEPEHLALRLGEVARLRVEGADAAGASCMSAASVLGPGPELEIPSPRKPGLVEVYCDVGERNAHAQITFIDTPSLPVANPYGGGVALFKLRRLVRRLEDPVGTQRTGLPSLDAKLRRLRAWALPAFPFDRRGARDYVGLDHWIAIDVPEGVNFYQAVGWLRDDRELHAESYTPADGDFLRVTRGEDWPVSLTSVTRSGGPPRRARVRRVIDHDPSVEASWDLDVIGAPAVWKKTMGQGVRIAVVDSGVDVNHASIAPNLVSKKSERLGDDVDGNGIPGDENGANLAHMAIAHAKTRPPEAPRLSLGLVGDVSDWDGALEGRSQKRWGHGTMVASLAAGAGGHGGRLGVAPRAEILAVDVQENLRTSSSRLLDEDPRMREPVAGDTPLRSSVWSRAAGIVYATAEGSRVITCAWSSERASWLLHDALLYAEDNCAIPVCSASESGGYPARWSRSWLGDHEEGTGTVHDAWNGKATPDFFRRPLRGTVIAGDRADATPPPDLVVPTRAGSRRLHAAVSIPRNDAAPHPDRRTADFEGPDAATGLVAGAAALVTGSRPDLEPWAIRAALRSESAPARLSLPDALEAAKGQPTGACEPILSRQELPELARPWWKRVKIKTKLERRDSQPPPASQYPED